MTEPRWLDAAQQRDWRAFIDGSARFKNLLACGLKDRHGLSSEEFEILIRLSEPEERRLRMSDLAAEANHSRSRLTHAVARLERRGYVQRHTGCPEDRRGVYAFLTDKGFDALHKAAGDHVNDVRDYFVDVIDPADLEAIGRAFRAVLDRLGKEPGPCPDD